MEVKTREYYRLSDTHRAFATMSFPTIKQAKKHIADDRKRLKENYENDKHPMTKENYDYWMGIKYQIEHCVETSFVIFEEGQSKTINLKK